MPLESLDHTSTARGTLLSWRPLLQHFARFYLPIKWNTLKTFENSGRTDGWWSVIGIFASSYAVDILYCVPHCDAIVWVYSWTRTTLKPNPQYHCGLGVLGGDLGWLPNLNMQRWLLGLLRQCIVGQTTQARAARMAVTSCCIEKNPRDSKR